MISGRWAHLLFTPTEKDPERGLGSMSKLYTADTPLDAARLFYEDMQASFEAKTTRLNPGKMFAAIVTEYGVLPRTPVTIPIAELV